LPTKNFSTQDFELYFNQIFDNKIDDISIKEFLININNHQIPITAISGAVNSLQNRMIEIPNHQDAIDVCGTGGDKLNTLNISTAVSIILASMGIKVAKHGNVAVSSKSGSADIFRNLGINITSDLNIINQQLNQKKLSFLFAPFFHPSLKKLSEIRKSIKEPTIFNYIGPLLNPVRPNKQIIGTSKFSTMQKIADFFVTNRPNSHIYIVHGEDGMDEISISSPSFLLEVVNGKILEMQKINPLDYGLKNYPISAIIGKDSQYNTQQMLELFDGKYSPYHDIVCLNTAIALRLLEKFIDIKEGFQFTADILNSKSVLDYIKNYNF
jgi:anthranilate phosphoribosyltransferase